MTNESAILGLLAKQEQQIAALQAENAQLREQAANRAQVDALQAENHALRDRLRTVDPDYRDPEHEGSPM